MSDISSIPEIRDFRLIIQCLVFAKLHLFSRKPFSLAAFLSVFCLLESSSIQPMVYRAILNLLCLITPFLVMLSRVYLQYHTVNQVLGGYLIGAVLGLTFAKLSARFNRQVDGVIQAVINLLSPLNQLKIVQMLAFETRKSTSKRKN